MIDTQESVTAKLCSFARAYHSNYSRQKIFDDYLAYDIMGIEEYREVGQLIENNFNFDSIGKNAHFKPSRVYPILDKYISPIPLSRIAYAEAKLADFAERYGRCQYVICGAGMDTFAFRNTNPDIKVFELDHPDTQRYKLKKIEKLEWNIPQNVRYVPIDFSKTSLDKALLKTEFDSKIPTFFSILGVTYYLTLSVFEQTVKSIASLNLDKAKLVFDYPDETTFSGNTASRVRELSQITAKLGEPMAHGYHYDELARALADNRFRIAEHMSPRAIQKRYFSRRSDNQYAFENIHFILADYRQKQGGNVYE